jgi:hypothetical protein
LAGRTTAERPPKATACGDIDCRISLVPRNSEPTAEGDLIVIFQEPVFQRFGAAELKQAGTWSAARFAALLSPTEAVTAADGWVPPETARLGLLARRRMLENAADAMPVKVVRAKQRTLVAN